MDSPPLMMILTMVVLAVDKSWRRAECCAESAWHVHGVYETGEYVWASSRGALTMPMK